MKVINVKTKQEVNDKYLDKMAKYYSFKYFGIEYSKSITFNNRFKSIGGYFQQFRDDSGKYNIKINPRVFSSHGINVLNSVIKHELIHWYLYIQGMNINHTKQFINIAHKIGANLYVPIVYNDYELECLDCGEHFIIRGRNLHLGLSNYLYNPKYYILDNNRFNLILQKGFIGYDLSKHVIHHRCLGLRNTTKLVKVITPEIKDEFEVPDLVQEDKQMD